MVAEKNAVGGNSGKTKTAATNATIVADATITADVDAITTADAMIAATRNLPTLN